jgi:predicted nucleic acid-binding protein
MIYLDTNILVSLHITDSLTPQATEWIAREATPLAISEWVRAEFHAVMGLRKRKAEQLKQKLRSRHWTYELKDIYICS